ncbi:MAG: phosphatidylglycerol lysyltransferase domain-containing protein [Gemmatimonadaceae bacterium]
MSRTGATPRPGDAPPEVLRARALVLRHGWNATAYQLLNPGFALWFSAAGDAVVGYVRRGGVNVVAGAPVCAVERLRAVHLEFEAASAAAGARVCYFGAGHRLEEELQAGGRRSVVLLGAQPVWDPAAFAGIVASHASLRAQLHRARNKGVRVVEWPAGRARSEPRLARVLAEWLATRGLPPLSFLVEPDTLGRLFDRRVFVAERAGEPVGFLVASPVPARDGWLVEQIIRGRGAPNGSAELLVASAMAAMAASGSPYATLGLAPLSRHAGVRSPPTPRWLRLVLELVRAHGRRFYNFDGLDSFKAKLQPQRWEPIYAISGEARFSPRTLRAITAAFSGGSPLVLVARALGRAVAQEARWLGEGRRAGS